jgi:hypothetical protein
MAGAAFYHFYFTMPDKMLEKSINQWMGNKNPSNPNDNSGKADFSKNLQAVLVKKDVKIESLIEFVEGVKLEEAKAFLQNCTSRAETSEKIDFQFITTQFDFGDFPIDSFKTEYELFYDPIKMDIALDLYEKNKNQMPVIFPMMKESIIRYLKKLDNDPANIGMQ